MNRHTVNRILADREFLGRCVDLARSEAPRECVGLISRGPASLALWRADNAADDPLHAFEIGVGEQRHILAEIATARHELIGILHSHPCEGADPSVADVAVARGNLSVIPHRLVWVIVGLHGDMGADPSVSAQLLP